jgi:hypothetical protein
VTSGPHRLLVCGCALLLLGACSAPSASRRYDSPAPPDLPLLSASTPERFDCDAGEGRYEARNLALPAGTTLLTGTLQFLEPRNDHNKPAIAHVRIAAPDGANTRAAGLMAGVGAEAPRTLVFFSADGNYDERFAALSVTTQPIPFTLRVSESGLTVTAAGVSKTIAVGKVSRTHLMLECSSAHVVFADLLPRSSP